MKHCNFFTFSSTYAFKIISWVGCWIYPELISFIILNIPVHILTNTHYSSQCTALFIRPCSKKTHLVLNIYIFMCRFGLMMAVKITLLIKSAFLHFYIMLSVLKKTRRLQLIWIVTFCLDYPRHSWVFQLNPTLVNSMQVRWP